MRKVVVVLVLFGGLLVPAAAHAAPLTAGMAAGGPFARASQGACVCQVRFADFYVTNSYRERSKALRAMRGQHISSWWRKRINRGVYDWQRGGYGSKPNWCLRNLRACRAVIACIGAAGVYYLNAPKVLSQRQLATGMAKNCAAAAALSLVTP
jgi:hypothetical protein